MDTSKLTNEAVKRAFDACADAKLYDDGNPRNFQRFVKEACGHEKFTSVEKVENEGKDIVGNFHTESWGDFTTYFRFPVNVEGKFCRLDIWTGEITNFLLIV